MSERALERRRGIQAELNRFKLAAGCADCGYNRHAVALDFDHIDPSTKRFNVAHASLSHSQEVIWVEVSKCEVRCSNCHRLKTWGDCPEDYEREVLFQ